MTVEGRQISAEKRHVCKVISQTDFAEDPCDRIRTYDFSEL